VPLPDATVTEATGGAKVQIKFSAAPTLATTNDVDATAREQCDHTRAHATCQRTEATMPCRFVGAPVFVQRNARMSSFTSV